VKGKGGEGRQGPQLKFLAMPLGLNHNYSQSQQTFSIVQGYALNVLTLLGRWIGTWLEKTLL